MAKDLRRYPRAECREDVRVIWTDSRGEPQYLAGKTVDISERGIRVELPQPVPVRTHIGLRSESLGLACSGSVRHCGRRGAKYFVGIAFSGTLPLHPRIVSLLASQVPADSLGIVR